MSNQGGQLPALLRAETDEASCRAAADLLADRLGAPVSIYSLEDGATLEVRSTTAAPDEADRSVQFSEVMLERTDRLTRSVRIDDCTNTRSAATAGQVANVYRSALFVPVDDWGMIVAADEQPDAFDDVDLGRAEMVAELLSIALSTDPPESSLADERLMTIASVLSHDLAAPINVARGYVRQTQDTGTIEYLEQAQAAIDRIEELVGGLETYARTGRTVGSVEPVDLHEAATVGWSMVDPVDATLETPTGETVLADPDRLHQVFENLFRNAVEHAGADVTVTVGTLDDRPGFYVEDDGPGIPPDERAAVFDHGYTGTEGGSGLGLSIVAGIVDAHGWEIQATDGADGGARFEVLT